MSATAGAGSGSGRRANGYRLKSYEFRQEREAGWRELEALLARADGGGLGSLAADELYRLPLLHRAALSSLSVARAISLDRNLVEYLESLCARAHVYVYGGKRTYGSTVQRFFLDTFPRRVWAMRRAVAVSALLTALGLACGYLLTLRDPDLFYGFVPEGLAGGRDPTSTAEELEEVLYSGGDKEQAGLSAFAGFLFTHNAQIGLLCFAAGIAAGVPVALLLFSNGVILGAFAALYTRADLALPFWLWILPHGVTELLAVMLCGAAGLRLGASLVFPGRHSRLDSLAIEGRHAAVVVIGCISLFLVAGLIEGYFRQMVHHDGVRLAVALATALLWGLYFGVLGRQRHGPETGPDADAGVPSPDVREPAS
jgi:uncharacterized membrane protein SpoIIM required for sporulation